MTQEELNNAFIDFFITGYSIFDNKEKRFLDPIKDREVIMDLFLGKQY